MATPEGAKHRDLEQRFRDLERKVRELASVTLRRPKFEVSQGDLTINGGDLVVDGGDFLLLDTDGSTVFRLGPQEFGDRGVSIYRENGTTALEVREQAEGFGQRLRIMDDAGNVLFSEWELGGGLSRPRLTMQVHPNGTPASWGTYGPERTTTSATFEPLFVAHSRRQNVLLQPLVAVKCSDATTAAEVRLVETTTGAVLDDFFTPGDWVGAIPAGSTSFVENQPAVVWSGGMDAQITIEVQARRTAGAGTVTVACPRIMGG